MNGGWSRRRVSLCPVSGINQQPTCPPLPTIYSPAGVGQFRCSLLWRSFFFTREKHDESLLLQVVLTFLFSPQCTSGGVVKSGEFRLVAIIFNLQMVGGCPGALLFTVGEYLYFPLFYFPLWRGGELGLGSRHAFAGLVGFDRSGIR